VVSDLVSSPPLGATIVGTPQLVPSFWGSAVSFDGTGDGIFLDHDPLEGLESFTIEVIMKPYGDGPAEQRYLHFGDPTRNRVMMETRVTTDRKWYHDVYVSSNAGGVALIDPQLLHDTDRWYHVALVFDRGEFALLVNGLEELAGEIEFTPHLPGRSSIGVRLNELFWYRGEFQRIRISDRALTVADFLPIPTGQE
jgi:hypothetical protein